MKGAVTLEYIATIIDPTAISAYSHAYKACVNEGVPDHLARYYAEREYGYPRSVALERAAVILDLVKEAREEVTSEVAGRLEDLERMNELRKEICGQNNCNCPRAKEMKVL